jgi:hypothetical protein
VIGEEGRLGRTLLPHEQKSDWRSRPHSNEVMTKMSTPAPTELAPLFIPANSNRVLGTHFSSGMDHIFEVISVLLF